jgi:hypothetical protein
MSFSGELGSCPVESKQIEAAVEKFKVCKLKSASNSIIQKATASDANKVYGRVLDVRTADNITVGLDYVDVEKFVPGTIKTLIASAAISSYDVPVGLAADGKIAALSANATPVSQFQIGRSYETATDDGDEILVSIDPKYIDY